VQRFPTALFRFPPKTLHHQCIDRIFHTRYTRNPLFTPTTRLRSRRVVVRHLHRVRIVLYIYNTYTYIYIYDPSYMVTPFVLHNISCTCSDQRRDNESHLFDGTVALMIVNKYFSCFLTFIPVDSVMSNGLIWLTLSNELLHVCISIICIIL